MRPQSDEAAPYYFAYIDRIQQDDVVRVLEAQNDETVSFLAGISEEKSLYRYAPGKWSIRELLSHINDTERLFIFRAMWFARGFEEPLPSFDQNVCVENSGADKISWANHVAEFQTIRSATVTFFQNLSDEAWGRAGIASDNKFTVRALAYIAAGHVDSHCAVIRERYL